jgi:Domain of unknown function (DUF4157)
MSSRTLAPTSKQAAASLTPANAGGVLQRQCACGDHAPGGECERCGKDRQIGMQSRARNKTGPAGAPPIVHQVLRSSGQSLAPSTRSFMESRFGHDFSRVRVHSDADATRSAVAVNAIAYTAGEHIIFRDGHYDPSSTQGRRLLAHELAHVVQQRQVLPTQTAKRAVAAAQAKLEIGAVGDRFEREADRIAEHVLSIPDAALVTYAAQAASAITRNPSAGTVLQRQNPPGAAACPTVINFSAAEPVHVPSCGAFRAQTDAAGITWSLAPDPTAVDAGTRIAANGAITIGAAQSAGQIKAVATAGSGCSFERPFSIRSNPTGIASTIKVAGPGNPANEYGGVFDHTFVSADGNAASVDNVAVGERFIGVPSPTGATHTIGPPTYPFGGNFTLNTATLTPNAANNWFLTATGQLGGTHDNVMTDRGNINVGHFVQSTSNPTPPQALPATTTLTQGLHWFCPQDTAANRWRMPAFVTVAHSRTLRNKAGVVEFVTTVNGLEVVDNYSGPLAVLNLTASPVSIPHSPSPSPAPPGGAPAPAPGAPAPPAARTVQITLDSLPATIPAGQSITFNIIGNALGCTIAANPANNHAAVLTIGQTAGTVTVEAADSTAVNRARVNVVIT